MSEPNSPVSGITPERAKIDALIKQLKASSEGDKLEKRAYWCAFLYGLIAALQGLDFLILYCGVLVVVLMFHSASEQRASKEIDLLLKIVRELERQSHDDGAQA